MCDRVHVQQRVSVYVMVYMCGIVHLYQSIYKHLGIPPSHDIKWTGNRPMCVCMGVCMCVCMYISSKYMYICHVSIPLHSPIA